MFANRRYTIKIGIIDADLLGRGQHRFPNLACMKLSGYYKETGHTVKLILNYDDVRIEQYDQLFLSKVFTATPVPDDVMKIPYLVYGGTGFFYNNAPPLPEEIEHHMPDYHLYDEWVDDQLRVSIPRSALSYYFDYSIGFTTRGCIRGCSFCVNQHSRQCILHSPVDEFYDPTRKYITLLDDNIFACPDWQQIFHSLQDTKKPFQFKQGCDERLLTDEKCKELFVISKWKGDFIFAYDNKKDTELIISKLDMIRKYTNKVPKFYCLCGFNHDTPGKYDDSFWKQDICDLFYRIAVLLKYRCLPYIMRYADYELSPFRDIYIQVSRWCNQPAFVKKKSFTEFCEMHPEKSVTRRALTKLQHEFPEVYFKYCHLKFGQTNGEL